MFGELVIHASERLLRELIKHRCCLPFTVHCGMLRKPIFNKNFATETIIKMVASLINALTIEQGSWLRCTLGVNVKIKYYFVF